MHKVEVGRCCGLSNFHPYFWQLFFFMAAPAEEKQASLSQLPATAGKQRAEGPGGSLRGTDPGAVGLSVPPVPPPRAPSASSLESGCGHSLPARDHLSIRLSGSSLSMRPFVHPSQQKQPQHPERRESSSRLARACRCEVPQGGPFHHWGPEEIPKSERASSLSTRHWEIDPPYVLSIYLA